jgi:hypothetical protein
MFFALLYQSLDKRQRISANATITTIALSALHIDDDAHLL